MEIEPVHNRGCLWLFTAVASLGLAPLIAGRYYRQMPHRLSDEGITLRNGTRIPWSTVTRVAATDIYLGSGLSKRYMKTRYVITHAGGNVDLQTDTIRRPDEVVAYILERVPPQARTP